MAVDTEHPSYSDAAQDWQTMRNCMGGDRIMKAMSAASLYIPRLHDQADDDFRAFVLRATFFNAIGRTVSAHKGLIFRKDPNFNFPEALAPFLEDATMHGLSFYDYVKDSVQEVLVTGRRGTLVDWDSGPENRAYISAYRAEDIINWKSDRVGGHVVLTLLVLHEIDSHFMVGIDGAAADAPDEFETGAYDQWRIYRLRVGEDGAPYCTCEVYRRKQKGAKKTAEPEFVKIDAKTPTRRGIPLDRIPFVFHGACNGLPDIDGPPLLDMAHINISQFRTSADLENGRHFTGCPTVYAIKFGGGSAADRKKGAGSDEVLYLGSQKAWTTEEDGASCGFLEFTGAGLGALTEAMTEKAEQMAALGARMLEPEAKKAEAFGTVALRNVGETSALMALAIACGESLSDVMRLVAWWSGTERAPADLAKTVNVEINTDFLSAALAPEMLKELAAAYAGAVIDFETLYYNLVRGELIEPGRTREQMKASIDANPPGLLPFEPPPPAAGAGGGA